MNITGSLQKKHKRWYVFLNLYSKEGKRYQKSVDTRLSVNGNNLRKAKQFLKDILAEYSKNNVVYRDNQLFCDYIVEWLQNHKPNVQQSTFESYEKAIYGVIYPYFKEKRIRLQDLTHHDLKAFYRVMTDKGNSASTLRKYHANIRKSLQDAMIDELVGRNVADLVRLPKVPKYVAGYYNATQVKALLETTRGHILETAILLTVYYGLRRSEVAGLMWSNIDFDNRTFVIKVTKVKQKTTIVKERTKNNSSYRTLYMWDNIYNHLKRLNVKQKADKLAFGNAYKDNDFVCRWEDGTPIKLNYFTGAIKIFAPKANLPIIRFHDLRHSCASVLIANGVDIKEIQNLLGHSDIHTTSEIYTHMEFEQKKRVSKVMEDILFGDVTQMLPERDFEVKNSKKQTFPGIKKA